MKDMRICMGMPCKIEIADPRATAADFDVVYKYYAHIDATFSTYKASSEITAINAKTLSLELASDEMKEVFALSEETRKLTDGYFDIRNKDGNYDPSGLVKGLAIHRGALLLKERGFSNYCVEIAGDIEVSGVNSDGGTWVIGIQNPFKNTEVVKRIFAHNIGIATSGVYLQGDHIYNPKDHTEKIKDIASLTVIGPNIFEADRYATACFAMGKEGIYFLEQLPGFEGYLIDKGGIATMTTGFSKYTTPI